MSTTTIDKIALRQRQPKKKQRISKGSTKYPCLNLPQCLPNPKIQLIFTLSIDDTTKTYYLMRGINLFFYSPCRHTKLANKHIAWNFLKGIRKNNFDTLNDKSIKKIQLDIEMSFYEAKGEKKITQNQTAIFEENQSNQRLIDQNQQKSIKQINNKISPYDQIQRLLRGKHQSQQTLKSKRQILCKSIQQFQQMTKQLAKVLSESSCIEMKKIPIVGFISGLCFNLFRLVRQERQEIQAEKCEQETVQDIEMNLQPKNEIQTLKNLKDIGTLDQSFFTRIQAVNKNLLQAYNQKNQIKNQVKNIKKQLENAEKQFSKQFYQFYKQKPEICLKMQQLNNEQIELKKELANLNYKKPIKQFQTEYKKYTQIPYIHHQLFYYSDQNFIKNIKEFNNISKSRFHNKGQTNQYLQRQEALTIILALIIPFKYEINKNLQDCLIIANTSKKIVTLILEDLTKIRNLSLQATSQFSFEDENFYIEQKENGVKHICPRYGRKIYLSAINGEGKIYANRIFCLDQEKICIEPIQGDEDRCRIKTKKGFYLSSDENGQVSANTKEADDRSIFRFKEFQDDEAAFRDFNYKYLGVPRKNK